MRTNTVLYGWTPVIVAILCPVACALSACGTVLPPLEESDGSAPVVDTGTPRDDVADDGTFPPDQDASDVLFADADVDTVVRDGGADVCRNCPDVSAEGGSDASADQITDGRTGDTDVRAVDGDAATCPSPVNCALPGCNGVSCGLNGLVCRSSMCACPGGQTKESTCGDSMDNDCDGLTDCTDPDCIRLQCGASVNQRCCGTTCVNTETDPANCQGCGLACAAGQLCKRITDDAGTRGACTCNATNTQCPKNPAQVCRSGNNDGQDLICACDFAGFGHVGCAEGQVCVDTLRANFCRY
jgi:hypothetical protein